MVFGYSTSFLGKHKGETDLQSSSPPHSSTSSLETPSQICLAGTRAYLHSSPPHSSHRVICCSVSGWVYSQTEEFLGSSEGNDQGISRGQGTQIGL
ncbi:hypothetical protein SLEP1_g42808 [Rubroshorea leprosula]|uniref:Uncharacterized protein n=1 Tax=Rubroshorea leprosula TaxID=152421 RepID=A0AAV5LAZ4_9ROSI|nr:hypothetical protein SLEP1_g42808 [Rubroshorea leprosula]